MIWTTTPWTLPSNQLVAVNEALDYAFCQEDGVDGTIVIAKELVESLAEKTKRTLTVIKVVKGSELVGLCYEPPFEYYVSKLGRTPAR